jgi:hypothetical protein
VIFAATLWQIVHNAGERGYEIIALNRKNVTGQ